MKRKLSLLLALVVVTTSILINPSSVKAGVLTGPTEIWTWINAMRELDGQDFSIKGFIQSAFHTVGLVTPWDANYPTLEEYMKQQTADDKGVDVSEVTDHDVYEYIDNRITNVTYDGCKIGDELNADIKYMANLLETSSPMYTGYSLDLRYYDNGYRTSFIQNEIIPNQDNYLYFIASFNGTNPISRAIKVDKTKFSFVSSSRTNPYSVANLYNNMTFEGNIQTDGTKVFDIAIDGTYAESSNTNDIGTPNFRVMNENYSYRQTDYNVYANNSTIGYLHGATLVSYGKVYSYQIFGNYTLFKQSARGEAPYYIDNSVYSNWQNSTGDYVVNNSNSNHTTYGDITSYINSFNTENGINPSPEDVEKFINNNNNTIINGGGSGGSGGSGTNGTINNTNNNNPVFNNNPNININFGFPSLSSNTVSGNGSSGSSGGSGGIFDWLGSVGSTLGNLVKGLGELISNLFEGIVQAVTTILESVPNILTPLVEYVFGGLPEELQALITLGVTCIIMVAVIKAIKG